MFATGKIIPSNSDVLAVSYGDDTGLYVEFYWREVHNEQRSTAEGRPIYESKEYVRIIAPGDKTKNWDRPVRKRADGSTPSDPERWPRQWQAFQNQEKQVLEGTPLEEWPQITRADAASLKAMNIHTIEQLAALGDNGINWLGGMKYRDMAIAWIKKAKEGAGSAQFAKEKEYLQSQIDALTNQINGLRAAGLQEASAPPKKPGRKPKVKDEQNTSSTNTAGNG